MDDIDRRLYALPKLVYNFDNGTYVFTSSDAPEDQNYVDLLQRAAKYNDEIMASLSDNNTLEEKEQLVWYFDQIVKLVRDFKSSPSYTKTIISQLGEKDKNDLLAQIDAYTQIRLMKSTIKAQNHK